MRKSIKITHFKCNTVGDLLDELANIAKNPELQSVLDSAIEGINGDTYTAFRIITRTLSDKSTVLDFELCEE